MMMIFHILTNSLFKYYAHLVTFAVEKTFGL